MSEIFRHAVKHVQIILKVAISLLPVIDPCCNDLPTLFFELYMAVNPRFAIETSMQSVIVSDIQVFPVSAATVLSHCVNRTGILSAS